MATYQKKDPVVGQSVGWIFPSMAPESHQEYIGNLIRQYGRGGLQIVTAEKNETSGWTVTLSNYGEQIMTAEGKPRKFEWWYLIPITLPISS